MTPNEKQEQTKQQLIDDMVMFGTAVSKTEIEDGKPVMKYVDPMADEMRVAVYNSGHTDSAMQIHHIPTTESAYDGSKLRYAIGFDPFDMGSIGPSAFSIWDTKNRCLYFRRSKYRLPRKLKKKVKGGRNTIFAHTRLKMHYDVYRYANSKTPVSNLLNKLIKQGGGE